MINLVALFSACNIYDYSHYVTAHSVVLTLAVLSGLSCIEFLCASHSGVLLLPVSRTEFITLLPSNISGCSPNTVLSPCSSPIVSHLWLRKSPLFSMFVFIDFRVCHDVSWFKEMEQHPSGLVVYQWLNGYGKIGRAPVRPFAHFGISWSNPFAVFQVCVRSCSPAQCAAVARWL